MAENLYHWLFWDSECCRIGEDASIGFDHFVQLLLRSKHNENDKKSLLSLFNQRRVQCDEQDEELIVFEDIAPFLFRISDFDMQNELVLIALHAIGINEQILGQSAHILSNQMFDDALFISDWEQFMNFDKDFDQNEECFEFLQFDKDFQQKQQADKTVDDDILLQFALNIFVSIHIRYSSMRKEGDYLPLQCSMLLIVKELHGVNECKAQCKQLLKNNQFNLRLYSFYAQIELKYAAAKVDSKAIKEAIKVYKNSLKMLNAVPVEEKCYAPMLFFEYLFVEILHKKSSEIEKIIGLMVSAARFEFNVISWKKQKRKESISKLQINEAHLKFMAMLQQKDDSFRKSPNCALIKTKHSSLFNSRCPATYFFIFGFILRLLTDYDNMQQCVEYILCQLIEKNKGTKYQFIGNKFSSQSEIEFILYYALKTIEWFNDINNKTMHCCQRANNKQYTLDLVKCACKLFPTNCYFLSCIEENTLNQFEIRCIYNSLLTNSTVVSIDPSSCCNQLIVWIKFMLFEIKHNSLSMSLFDAGLLIPSCRYNVAFWRLYLCYLSYRHHLQFEQNHRSKTDIVGELESKLTRYQQQRLKRQKRFVQNQEEKSINRLKHVFEMALQTLTISQQLYLLLPRRYCTQNELNQYVQQLKSKHIAL